MDLPRQISSQASIQEDLTLGLSIISVLQLNALRILDQQACSLPMDLGRQRARACHTLFNKLEANAIQEMVVCHLDLMNMEAIEDQAIILAAKICEKIHIHLICLVKGWLHSGII